MHPPSSERHQARVLIDRKLRTDADFDAFCLDSFPDVYRRFTTSMERTQKVNLLLTIEEDPSIIVHRLSERPAPGLERTLLRNPWWLGGSAVLMLSLLLAVRAMHKPVRPFQVERSRTTVEANLRTATVLPSTSAVPPATAQVARPATGINAGNQIVNSPAAQMTNSAHLPKATSRSRVNSGNRIENSPGAKMLNTLDIAGSR